MILVMIVFGGIGSVWGVVLGALILQAHSLERERERSHAAVNALIAERQSIGEQLTFGPGGPLKMVRETHLWRVAQNLEVA